jgi:CRISPR-associated protein Csb3
MMKTRFGIDPRSAWNALDMGYSPNEHSQDTATFPVVELLGAIGLQGFRPDAGRRESVRYHLWRIWLPRVPARKAAIFPWPGLAAASYEFSIAKRGQSYKFFTFAKPVEEA